MRQFATPRLVVSKCLGFAACRWNGDTINDDFVEMLKPFVEFVPVCAEMEIELGCPREPIRVVKQGAEQRLVQSASGGDFTDRMRAFVKRWLADVGAVDGFLLKSRSPSCGVKDVKLYPGPGKVGVIGKTAGFFGGAAVENFPELPVEDEARLGDWRIREHFLMRIFLQADFRRVEETGTMAALVNFHTANKLAFMAASQRALRVMGKIVANHEHLPPGKVIAAYRAELAGALVKMARHTGVINVLQHALGYVSDELKAPERKYFLAALERYRLGRVPMSVPVNVMHEFAIRTEARYLLGQTLFEPYPEELMLVTDSGKGRTTR